MEKIGYARVSMQDQNLDMQLDALRAASCLHIYQEKASGKTTRGRSELDHCLKAVRSGDKLMVWKLDRLGRNLGEIATLISDLAERGIALESITDGIDTSGPMGKAFAHLALIFAEMERDRIRERTVAGLVAARARGRVGGRRKALTPEQEEMVRSAMRAPQLSPTQIAAHFGISRSTLYKYAPKGSKVLAKANNLAFIAD